MNIYWMLEKVDRQWMRSPIEGTWRSFEIQEPPPLLTWMWMPRRRVSFEMDEVLSVILGRYVRFQNLNC